MKVTIVVPDNIVLVNGKAHTIDCSAFVAVHAVQWDGDAGEVEYADVEGAKIPNQLISDISPYQSLIDAWQAVEDYVPPPPSPPTMTDLIIYANRAQWAKATGGYATTVNGIECRIPTSTESLSLINGKFVRLQQPNPPTSIAWQVGPTTFVDIPVADFTTLAVAIADFVQTTFDKLRNEVLPAIEAGTITTTAQIDTVFGTL
jgi:hypothetical protein